MITLNLPEVLWLAGRPDEIEKVLKLPDATLIGHIDDVRSLLAPIVTQQNVLVMQPFMRRGVTVPATFILLQGRLVGLIQQKSTEHAK